MNYILSCGDAKEYLKTLPSESVDLIITDPPYESLEKWRNIGTTARLKDNWFPVVKNDYFPGLLAEFFRVAKKDSHLYLFVDPETSFIVRPMIEQAGFKFWKPLVWDKKKIGMGYHYRARYEFILFAEKGKRHLHNKSLSDVIEFPRINNGYPTEKPAEVSEILIQQSSEENSIVLDPFCGSGSVGVAALKNKRIFWGNDLQEKAIELSKNRLLNMENKT